ncbi:uncharacterized protein LOC135824264 [Sycon ciliatum]|uniref:uncharacterized protein LOC135824264 n=1 Tax=Sycon ciliatum TaxID=27933 RepID=UPI0031F70A0A
MSSVRLSTDGKLGRRMSNGSASVRSTGSTGSNNSKGTSNSLRDTWQRRPRLAIPFDRQRSSQDICEGETSFDLSEPVPDDDTNSDDVDVHLVRIFLKDESYRTVRFTDNWKCGHILNNMWRRMEQLPGERPDFMLYMIYRKGGARFVKDSESSIVLLGDELIEVEKIYLRHKEDRTGVKRVSLDNGGKGELVLKQGGIYGTVRGTSAAPNPYAEAMGGSRTVSILKPEAVQSRNFALAFSQAWEKGTELEQLGAENPLVYSSISNGDTYFINSSNRCPDDFFE